MNIIIKMNRGTKKININIKVKIKIKKVKIYHKFYKIKRIKKKVQYKKIVKENKMIFLICL